MSFFKKFISKFNNKKQQLNIVQEGFVDYQQQEEQINEVEFVDNNYQQEEFEEVQNNFKLENN